MVDREQIGMRIAALRRREGRSRAALEAPFTAAVKLNPCLYKMHSGIVPVFLENAMVVFIEIQLVHSKRN